MPSTAPVISATAQAIVFSATSNIIAQALTIYQENKSFALDTTALTQFVLYSLLSTPPNFLWQEWLEDTFPSRTPASTSATAIQKGSQAANSNSVPPTTTNATVKASSSKLNVRNTAYKFALDQTFGATLNTVGFIAGIGALQGKNRAQISEAVKNDTVPMFLAGCKLWPLVSIICFTLIPFQWRLAFQSIAGVAWGVYLSLAAGDH